MFIHIGQSKRYSYVVAQQILEIGGGTGYLKLANVKKEDYRDAIHAMRKMKNGDELWSEAVAVCGRGYGGKLDKKKAFASWMGLEAHKNW